MANLREELGKKGIDVGGDVIILIVAAVVALAVVGGTLIQLLNVL